MFQVTVPSWGSGAKTPKFEVVQSPLKADGDASKKRIRDTKEDDKTTAKAAPNAKKPKLAEAQPSKAPTDKPETKQERVNKPAKGPKATSSAGDRSTSNSGSAKHAASTAPTSTQTKRNDTPKKTGKSAQVDGTGFNKPSQAGNSNSAKSAPQAKKSEPAHKAKKAGKGKNGKHGKKGRGNDSDADSIDELFGSYGGSDSEVSFTSDEGSMGEIIIKSPHELLKHTEDSLESSTEITAKRDDFSSDGFSSESESEKKSSKSVSQSSKKGGKKAAHNEGSEESDDEESAGSAKGRGKNTQMSALQEQMKASLEGGRFRFLNQKLYTSEGKEAFSLFQQQPELFDFYHKGYRNQVEKWPENPLDIIISWLKKQPYSVVVADFGCGEARLAAEVTAHRCAGKKHKLGSNKSLNIYSFDLVARNPRITACDIAHVPLEKETVDVAVFCLSLMGTNVVDFLKEAFRVLRPGGILKIAEVKSRFEKVATFLEDLRLAGFDLQSKDETNKMFILFDCVKSDRKPTKNVITLKPCIYKRR